jgi:hypothetical protein
MMARSGTALMSRSGGNDEEGKLVMEVRGKWKNRGPTIVLDRQIDGGEI